MDPIHTLVAPQSCPETAELPADLRAAYDGDLCFPTAPAERPYVFANFVSTLDGVVSFNMPGQSEGSEISGSNQADQFTMGLLRSACDALVMGSGTFEVTGHGTLWFPESVYPAATDLYKRYRQDVLKKSECPLLVIVSGTGRLDLSRAAFHTKRQRVLIVTSEQGKQNLQGASNVPGLEARALPLEDGRLNPLAILRLLRQEFDVRLALNEGGPTLFGQFLAGGLVDELFLTVAPQIAGRTSQHHRLSPQHRRLSLVENIEFSPGEAPWWRLLSAKQAANHLFLRYQKDGRIKAVSK